MSDDRFNEYCEGLLATYTRSNQRAVTRHLESLRNSLRSQGNHVVQTMFGGSVRRGTDVAGLSDVDALLIVDVFARHRQRQKDSVSACVINAFTSTRTYGNLAVTVTFGRTEYSSCPYAPPARSYCEPEPWVENVVRPDTFAGELSAVNQANHGRVTPTIKLAKAIADCHITRQARKISGYHMESLAIDAFRNYQGTRDPKAMLDHLLTHSMTAVMQPIIDSTGQSRHVDEYLGPAQSRCREGARTHFGQMRGKVRQCVTRAQFNALFCL